MSSGRKAKFVESSTDSKQNEAVLWMLFEMFTNFDTLVNTTTAGEKIYAQALIYRQQRIYAYHNQ
jgi:hypothetical protein